jgi:uncharacterized membrane protein
MSRAPGWFGSFCRAALCLVGSLPILAFALGRAPGLAGIASALDRWFAFQCERDPSRTFHVGGAMLPVCARCLGIYLGLGFGALVLRPRLAVWPLRLWVGGASLLMLVDVVSEYLGLRPAWAILRLLTGLLLAYPVGSSLVWAVRGDRAELD